MTSSISPRSPQPGSANPDPYRQYVIQVTWRVVAWFVTFNLLYQIIQPLDLPISLYNSVFPGRLRFAYAKENSSNLMINETWLSRLIADHIVSRPKQADEYRMIMLGSSELWGFTNTADATAPVRLDQMGLQRADGKTIHAYNLAYIWANTFKDLMILDYILQHQADKPDAVILFVNNDSFRIVIDSHPLYADNADLGVELLERYHIRGIDFPPLYDAVNTAPWWVRHSFIGERNALAYALINQMYAPMWAGLHVDMALPSKLPIQTSRAPAPTAAESNLEYQGILEAFKDLSNEYHFSFGIVMTPMNRAVPLFVDALAAKTKSLNIPVLNCSNLLPPQQFTDFALHFSNEGHRLLAEEVARWIETRQTDPEAPLWIECPRYFEN
jgi:hypothetical protein